MWLQLQADSGMQAEVSGCKKLQGAWVGRYRGRSDRTDASQTKPDGWLTLTASLAGLTSTLGEPAAISSCSCCVVMLSLTCAACLTCQHACKPRKNMTQSGCMRGEVLLAAFMNVESHSKVADLTQLLRNRTNRWASMQCTSSHRAAQ